MATFLVEGGYKLKGEIEPQGAKNEALQVICAAMLTAEEVIIENIPDILDIRNLMDLLEGIGVRIREIGAGAYSIQADDVDLDKLTSESYLQKSAALRGSVMLVGPLLARFGKAVISKPGGDKIGRRRLDTHFTGIQKLGANFVFDYSIFLSGKCRSA